MEGLKPSGGLDVFGKMKNPSVRATAVRQVSVAPYMKEGSRVLPGWGGLRREDGVDINLSPAAATPPPFDHTEGWNAWRIAPMVWPQTKHTLCWRVTDGVSCRSHGSRQRRLHGNQMWRRLTAGDPSRGRSGLSGCSSN